MIIAYSSLFPSTRGALIMAYRPSEYREVPPVDLLSWIFENNGVDPETDILIDAANNGNRLNTRQAVSLIRKLIAGFRVAGLEAGDTVCMHAFNSILYPLLYFGIIGAGGLPKAAATSHYALVAAGVAMRSSEKRPYECSRLISLPLFHSFGASFVQISAFHYDKPTYVMRRFNAEGFIQALNRSKVTETAVVPAMLASIVRQRIPPNMLTSLRRIWCAGSSLSPRLSKAIVMDKQGFEVVDAGVQGELEIRGPSMMNEYSGCPTGTVETLRGGWLKTGDFGYVKNDKVYIVGRIKELIKVRGWQVSPNEIEDVLLMHPSIIDAAVIGVSRSGTDPVDELPRAYVVINKEEPVSVDDLEVMRFVQDRLASFKALGSGLDSSRPGSIHTRGGYFLSHDEQLRQFDPSFFGISPLEASAMDPQQRKLLEVVYESFENAGATLEELSGSKTSCFVGCFTNDMRSMASRDLEYGVPYEMTGSDMTILSNRINYVFDLKGPSMTVDTACSSSLYALHLACQSLISAESDAAVVAGSNIINDIEQHIASVRLGVLSPTSICHTFDERADGFGRGEGVCAIYIKTLSAAIADNDPIRAVIRATAVNSSGKSQGINHPSSKDQEAVIREAYAKANLRYEDTGWFECHGTGTPVGDPIEVLAAGDVFAPGRTPDNPLLLGSIKTNIGHTEGASGLASIIKAVLSIENDLIPATVGVERLNPAIDFKNGRLEVARATTPWSEKLCKRLMIRTAALAAVADKYSAADIAYTLARKRSRHRCTAFTTVTEPDVKSKLVLEKIQHPSIMVTEPLVIAFVFTGQGAQWPGMGYGLVQQYPIVRETMSTLQRALDALPMPPEWRLVEELSKPVGASRMHETALAQPLSTALQIALTVLLQSWGISAKAVVGHSSGEVAAAFAAGLLTPPEAISVAYSRGIAVNKYGKPGAMMAVGLGPGEVLSYIHDQPGVVIACQNSPQSVTLSGEAAAIATVHTSLCEAGIFARILNTSQNAYHSHLVKEAGQYYEDSFKASLTASKPAVEKSNIPMYSCINGRVLDSPDDVRIAYWRQNLENPVNFTQALSALIEAQPRVNCLIEVGMHCALAGPIKQIRSSLGIKPEELCYLPSIVRSEDNVGSFLKLAGELWATGYPVDLTAINGPGCFVPELPTYQWSYEEGLLWTENRLSRQVRFREHARHDLLGTLVVPSSAFNPTWRNRLSIKDVPWLSDHRVGTDVLFPAAGYCAMAIEAVTQFGKSSKTLVEGITIQHLNIKAPLVLPPDGEAETLFDLHTIHGSTSQVDRKVLEFSLSSVSADDRWIEHAFGKIVLHPSNEVPSIRNGNVKNISCAEDIGRSDDKWYTALSGIGLHYGPAFRPLKNIQPSASPKEAATAQINLQPSQGVMIDESRYEIHPATLDGCIQLSVIAACKGDVKGISKAYLPTTIENLTIWRDPDLQHLPTEGLLFGHGSCQGMRSVRGSSELTTLDGHLLAQMTVSLMSLEGDFANQKVEQFREPFTKLIWQPIADDHALLNLTRNIGDLRNVQAPKLWLVYKSWSSSLLKAIETYASDCHIDYESIPTSAVEANIPKGSRIMMLAELEDPILINMTSEEMVVIKTLFNRASSMLWVTPGGLFGGKKPEYSLFPGTIKSITKAQPSLRLSSIDIDPDDTDVMVLAKLILQHEIRLFRDDDRSLDDQFVICDSLLKPDPQLCHIKDNLELAFQQVGRMESFFFTEKSVAPVLTSDEVKLRPIAYALGQREASVLRGAEVAGHFSNVVVAVVEHLGPQAGAFKAGDRVICCSPSRFDSSVIVSETVCELLHPGEDSGDMVTSLLPYCIALHALGHLAQGQTVLIHGLSKVLALAATRISQAYGSTVVLLLDSETDIAVFKQRFPDINAQFTTSSGFARKLSALTSIQGVSVALVSPTNSDMTEIWRSLARNGRLTYILESSEMPNLGSLDPSVFMKGVSITSLNAYDMLETQLEQMHKLVRSVLSLLRDGTLPRLSPSATFDISELPAAVAAIAHSKTMIDIVLTYEQHSLVPIHEPYRPVLFSSDYSYLLVGCLGGLGQSLVRWMFSRGARHLIFLSRSGTDKSEAAQFVGELIKLEAIPVVVRGDVSIRSDVENAIKQAKTPIRGVMQLAMALKSNLFEDMSAEDWHKVLAPKVQGTINLHEALLHEPLDFFVMTSSTLGVAGASTQSNYAAANAFLNSMARHRWSLGLEACSIALGMIIGIGHVETHPEVKEAFTQRNVYGIPEDDFLRMMEMACRPRGTITPLSEHDPLSVAHMVTGMEPSKIANSGALPSWLSDPRFEDIAAAIAKTGNETSSAHSATTTASILRTALATNDNDSVRKTLTSLIFAHFSKLTMVSVEKLNYSSTRLLSEFGMDSMIVAELRSWAWRELKVDVPFMVLLEGGLTLNGLVDMIWSKIDWDAWKVGK
ncbi:ketoacyl-synt-domain-containing protein, partial [Aureobasidium melanogenum]